MKITSTIIALFLTLSLSAQKTGDFLYKGDVGAVVHKGTSAYDKEEQRYELSASGANIWFTKDEFHYLYNKMEGDFILQARGELVGEGVDAHRKFGFMVRSALDTNATMVCTAIHGDGLTSLQYRKAKNGNVEQKEFTIKSPDVFQLERKGNRYIMSVAHQGEVYVTEQIDLNLGATVYAGLYLCSHNKDVVEKALFTNVRVIYPMKEGFQPYRDYIGSYIETMDVGTGHRKIHFTSTQSLQAPNWTPDNKSLLYNTSSGLMYRFDMKDNKTELINTDSVKANNNDHVLSFDGKMLGLSSRTGAYNSIVYTVPVKGGVPKRITPLGPSYLHGFSPDGKFLIYTAERSNNNYDIYKIPSDGGAEIRLTTDAALDDGSEYSPDGKYIYFNSTRSGTMQIWRMLADGSNQEQITKDEFNNWFPHVSPDGKWIVILSYQKDVRPDDHPFYRHVYLRLMPAAGGDPVVIAYLYGGQGSINTPSWSPDSKRIAFVSNTVVK